MAPTHTLPAATAKGPSFSETLWCVGESGKVFIAEEGEERSVQCLSICLWLVKQDSHNHRVISSCFYWTSPVRAAGWDQTFKSWSTLELLSENKDEWLLYDSPDDRLAKMYRRPCSRHFCLLMLRMLLSVCVRVGFHPWLNCWNKQALFKTAEGIPYADTWNRYLSLYVYSPCSGVYFSLLLQFWVLFHETGSCRSWFGICGWTLFAADELNICLWPVFLFRYSHRQRSGRHIPTTSHGL